MPRTIILCYGLKLNTKKRILNTCLLAAQHLRNIFLANLDWAAFWVDKSLFTTQHAQECYQPNVTALFYLHLFNYLHDKGLMYSMSTNFNEKGRFQAYWRELFLLCKEKIPADFGEKPLRTCFDVDVDYKIRN